MVARTDWFQRYVRETDFLQRYPFYAGVLAQLEFVATTEVPVMGVRWSGNHYQLLVNEAFFAARPRYRAGVLLHEVHHLVLGHLARRCYHDAARPDLMMLAMEVSANEYITEPLPEPIVWEQYRAQGLGPHQSTLGRYERLCAFAATPAGAAFRGPKGFDSHGDAAWRRGGIGIDDVVRGLRLPTGAAASMHRVLQHAHEIGTTARRAMPPSRRTAAPRRRSGRDIIEALFDPQPDPDGLLGRNVEATIQEFAPASGARVVDWRAALRDFVGRTPHHDWQRPNRRQPHRLFEVPGRAWRGSRPRLMVAIDTSGSMGPTELGAVARELQGLSDRAELTIVECDESIQRIYPFAGKLDGVLGGGGTDLRPPFAAELLRAHGPDGIVYFTDGQGPMPTTAPHVPVLWVLTCEIDPPPEFGRRAHLMVAPSEDDWGMPF